MIVMCPPDKLMLDDSGIEVTSLERDANDQCEKFMIALKKWSRIVRCRSTRGQVRVMARTWHTGIRSLLCFDKGHLSVFGGAEVEEIMLCVPLQYVRVHLVPDCDNMFQISVLSQLADGMGHGIFVAVRDCSVRDRWLVSLSDIPGMKIDGWSCSKDMVSTVASRNCMNGKPPLVNWIS